MGYLFAAVLFAGAAGDAVCLQAIDAVGLPSETRFRARGRIVAILADMGIRVVNPKRPGWCEKSTAGSMRPAVHVGMVRVGSTLQVTLRLVERHREIEVSEWQTSAELLLTDAMVPGLRTLAEVLRPTPKQGAGGVAIAEAVAPEKSAEPVALPESTVASDGASQYPSEVGWAPITLWGLSAASVGVGAYFGIRMRGYEQRVKDREIGSQLDARDAGRAARGANLSFVVAGVLGVAGLIVWLESDAERSVALLPSWGAGGPAVVLETEF